MKKALLITIIILILGGGFFYFKNKNNLTNPEGASSGFRNFFNFGSKETPPTTEGPGSETGGEFTTENPENVTIDQETGAVNNNTNVSVFGTNGPFTPLSTNTTGISGSEISSNNGVTSGSIGNGSTVGSGSGVTGGEVVLSGDTSTGNGGSQCTSDDTDIEFTPEEIARLRDLEARFYALAPNLRTDDDIQAELANYSSYKLLNAKYGELISYCENKSPLLPENINRRVSTPLYSDITANAYFVDGPDPDGIINMNSQTPKLKEIEKFLRITIW